MIFKVVCDKQSDQFYGRYARIYQGEMIVWEGYSCDEITEILRSVGILFTTENNDG